MPNLENGPSDNYVDERASFALPTYDKPGLLNIDQRNYRNNSTPVSNVPSMYIAYLTNNKLNLEEDVIINLNPVSLTWHDFINIFYGSGGNGFNINQANAGAHAITFYRQTYQTTENPSLSFVLKDQLFKAWSKKFAKPTSAITPQIAVHLTRFSFLAKSLYSIKEYIIATSLDETIGSLLDEGSIEVGDFDDLAVVDLVVSSKITYDPLKIAVLVNFTYRVHIPNYKNTNNHPGPYYSGDNSDNRPELMLGDEIGDIYATKRASNPIEKNRAQVPADDASGSVDNTIFSEISNWINQAEKNGKDDAKEEATEW